MPGTVEMNPSPEMEEGGEDLKFRKGGHWEPEYIQTILQWIHICAINVDIMTESACHYRRLIRRQTIISLLLTSLASTTSLSQFNLSTDTNLYFGLNIAFTAMTIIVALSTGFIKVYQVQEKLEQSIKLQQEWTALGSVLSSELQLPIKLRKDALLIIMKYKDVYLELFKQQTDTSPAIMNRIAKKYGLESYADLSLSELFERILWLERRRTIGANESDDTPGQHQIDTMPTIPTSVSKNKVVPITDEKENREPLDRFLQIVKFKSEQLHTPEINGRRKKISQMVMDQAFGDTFKGSSPQPPVHKSVPSSVSNVSRVQLADVADTVEAGQTPVTRSLPPIKQSAKAARISTNLNKKEKLQKEVQQLEVSPFPTPDKQARLEELRQQVHQLEEVIEMDEADSRSSKENTEEQTVQHV
jgi:hypothetical protein